MIRRSVFVGLAVAGTTALLIHAGCSTQQADLPRPAAASTGTASASASEGQRNVVTARGRVTFNEHIQPILAENCYACHGADSGSRKADLRLDRAEHAYRKRKEGDP